MRDDRPLRRETAQTKKTGPRKAEVSSPQDLVLVARRRLLLSQLVTLSKKAPKRRQLETPLFKKGTERGQLVTPLCIELPGELPTKTRPGTELRALIEHDLGSETALTLLASCPDGAALLHLHADIALPPVTSRLSAPCRADFPSGVLMLSMSPLHCPSLGVPSASTL